MKHYYLETDIIDYPLGYKRGHIKQLYQTVKKILLKSFEDDQPDNKTDDTELILIVDLRHNFDGPYVLNEIKYGKNGDKDWTILDESTGTEFYEKLKQVLEKETRVITQEELEIFQPLLKMNEGDDYLGGEKII